MNKRIAALALAAGLLAPATAVGAVQEPATMNTAQNPILCVSIDQLRGYENTVWHTGNRAFYAVTVYDMARVCQVRMVPTDLHWLSQEIEWWPNLSVQHYAEQVKRAAEGGARLIPS